MSFGFVAAQENFLIVLLNRLFSPLQVISRSVLLVVLVSGLIYSLPTFAESGSDKVVGEVKTENVDPVVDEAKIGAIKPEVREAAPLAEPINLMEQGLEVAGYLLLLMVFAVVVIRLGKNFQPRIGASGLIRIEDGHNLAPGVGVRLVRVGSRAWLVGVTKERVSLLAEMSQEELQSAKEGSS
jgi:flagellar biogenesis protein FliO